jgi:hypothetical protein
MCKQAERDQETKKLVFLMERVKRQIAERSDSGLKTDAGRLSAAVNSDSDSVRVPIRSVPLER